MLLNYLKAIIFGAVQGATEFLPVSSSGHLLVLHKYLGLPIQNEIMFDVLLHLATLLAVIFLFWSDIKKLFSSWFKSFIGKSDEYSKLSWYILIATIPAALVGVLFKDYIEDNFRNIPVVSFMLVLIGLLFIYIEKISVKINNLNQTSLGKVFFVGLAQTVALIPGTSRSGITIIAGLLTKLKREEAIRLSFLMSIPIIAGATVLSLGDLFTSDINKNEITLLAISFLAALFSSFLAIKYFLKLASKFGLNIFAYYRFAFAFILMVLWSINRYF
jgi:undecaprenyl-diphosphatase